MLQYEERTAKISHLEVEYWKKFVRSNLKIGVEIECNMERHEDNYNTMTQFNRTFNSSGQNNKFNSCGVCDVKSDGSLSNGVELVTVGRRVDFINMYAQYKHITDNMLTKDVYIDGRCGLHNHILIDYNDGYTSLEKNVPGIIVKNFMQLIRRYIPELIYITSTMYCPEHDENSICRNDYYSTIERLLRFTPKGKTLNAYYRSMRGDNRYNFVNFSHFSSVNDESDCFHLELRFPDGSLFPAQIASQGVLYTAMLFKAIELSECGLINTGTQEEWKETKILAQKIRNSNSDGRLSSVPDSVSLNKIKERTMSMIKFFKPQIDCVDKRAYAILAMLSDKPISIMLRNCTSENRRDKYKEINAMFYKTIQNIYNFDKSKYDRLIEIINLEEIVGCVSERQWIFKVAKKESKMFEEVAKQITELKRYRDLRFDAILGSICFA